MNLDSIRLRRELHEKGLWRDPVAGRPLDQGAWHARAFLGATAWLAACLLLPLLGMMLSGIVATSPWLGFACAVACCALSVPLLRRQGDFFPQLGSALSLAGLMLATSQVWSYEGPGWLGLAALAGAMYAAAPLSSHRFLCALAIAGALAMVLGDPLMLDTWGMAPVVLAGIALLLWCLQLRTMAQGRWHGLDAMAWAFAIVASALAVEIAFPWPSRLAETDGILSLLVAPSLHALAPAVVWWRASRGVSMQDGHLWPIQRATVGIVLLALVPVWLTIPGVAIGLCWLLLGFALVRMTLLGLGVTVMLAHLAAHYYQTLTSLLQKSASLLVAGGILIGLAMLIARLQRRNP